MGRITYVCITTVFGFMDTFFFIRLYCLVGCLSMIVWTHAVLGVLYTCVLYFCICTCSVKLNMFHNERRSSLLGPGVSYMMHHNQRPEQKQEKVGCTREANGEQFNESDF